MKTRKLKVLLGAVLIGIAIMALGLVVFNFNTISRMVVGFFTTFSWKAVITIVIASFVPGFLIGQHVGPFEKKNKGN